MLKLETILEAIRFLLLSMFSSMGMLALAHLIIMALTSEPDSPLYQQRITNVLMMMVASFTAAIFFQRMTTRLPRKAD